MRWIDARRIVTAVAHEEPGRDRSVVHFPRFSMRVYNSARTRRQPKQTIAMRREYAAALLDADESYTDSMEASLPSADWDLIVEYRRLAR